jgi:3-hydroxyacyl-[acyl-carrier-protein] dehydratase
MKALPLHREEIKKILPHREPMLLIDRITALREGEFIRAEYDLDPRLDYFMGHFPDMPVMPGVLTVESMAQTADVLLLLMDRYKGKIPYFIGIDQVKFLRKNQPGDTITIEVKIEKENVEKAVVTCKAKVFNGGELSSQGLVTLAMR